MIKMAVPLSSLMLLLLMFMYVTALLGMALFANRFHFDPITGLPLTFHDDGFRTAHVPRANFDDMLGAFTVVFQVLSGEDWDKVSGVAVAVLWNMPDKVSGVAVAVLWNMPR
jgi:hypothetical protein